MKNTEENPANVKNIKLKNRNYKPVLISIVSFFAGALAFALITNPGFIKTNSKGVDTNLLNSVESIINQKYDGDIDIKKQAEGAAAGAVAALGDPYTTYLNEEANKELSDDLKGELSGIGVEVGEKNGKLTVIAPIDGTPAAKAGLRAGDHIAAIDGIDSSTLTIDEAVTKIRGQKDTEVKLLIARVGEQPKEITIKRDLINVPSVTYEMKNDKIGYIKIRRFGEDTAQKVKLAGEVLKADGAKVIVLDVRDNPGGYLNSAVDVASEFMSSGLVVEERSRKSKPKVHNVSSGGVMTDIPVVMLINKGSASASEILAGALSDNGRAVLVGEKSYGKGSVQEIVCLSGSTLFSSSCSGPTLKVTVAHWYTPNGINISKEGIMPKYEVKLSNEDYNNGSDPQLQKALEVAKDQIR